MIMDSLIGGRRPACIGSLCWLLLLILSAGAHHHVKKNNTQGEEWGYVEVRPGAHMFWWLYRSSSRIAGASWPLVLWLQGGPGASGVGLGNFEEIGPLTTQLDPRPFTWLQKADLLFVDSPVGAGFSYVDNSSLLLTRDEDVAKDLLAFLKVFFQNHEAMEQSPFYIFAESYGGKHATLLGLVLHQAIKKGEINATLSGVALGDSWISPVDFVLSWGPVLKQFSRIDEVEEELINEQANKIKAEVNSGSNTNATRDWSRLENLVSRLSSNVDFYNLLMDENGSSTSLTLTDYQSKNLFLRFGTYVKQLKRLKEQVQVPLDLTSLMNGPIREKLQIIPSSVIWNEVSASVFEALTNEFMKDVINDVDELLSSGINVTIYNGQVDLICATQGAEAWVQKLKWTDLKQFRAARHAPMYCNSTGPTAGFVKSYKNLTFFWILLAGHMVPADNPCAALKMLEMVTRQ